MFPNNHSKSKPRASTGFLVRPRLGGALRSVYSNRLFSAYPPDKRKKLNKKSVVPKMEFRKRPDYADTAYREAVSRLRVLLADSYTPIKRPIRELDSAGEETDNQSLVSAGSRYSRIGRSYYHYTPITPRRYHNYYPTFRSNVYSGSTIEPDKVPNTDLPKLDATMSSAPPPELVNFIERQEDYIEQLEKESNFCREELSSLLTKVKEVINENEHLHEKQKNKIMKSVYEHLDTETETETETDLNKGKSPKKWKARILEGPSIVFESRISELEAQLTQYKIDLKKAHEENDDYKRKIADGSILDGLGYETYKKQLDKLQRERDTLQDTVNKLQNALAKLRDKENDTCDQVKRSLDVAEQAQYEKNTAELEIRRLKDELDRQHSKLREAIGDQGRRVADERSAVERRYTQQIEQLTTELGVQWESTNKMQLELDKQRRENGDLRRDVAQKQALIDELKKDMQTKIITLQSDIGVSGAEKSALEQQISNLHMSNERNDRQAKQELVRFQAEIQSLRQRLDRADADLIHSRRENIRLSEQVASLEKEINLNAAVSDERSKTPRGGEIMALPPPAPKVEEKHLSSMIEDMENKHAATVADLEGMIYSQNQLMDKLSTECHALTQKLEDASTRHKEEIRELQTSLDRLNNRFSQSQLQTSKHQDEERIPNGNERSAAPITKTLSRTNSKISVHSRKNSQEVVARDETVPTNDYQQYSTDPNQQFEADPNSQYIAADPNQTDPNSQYPDPNQQFAVDPNSQYIADPNQQFTADPNSEYSADPNQQFESDPNAAQYATDPNQQYMTQEQYDQMYDPNQQYEADPNAQYETDPNQQYPEEQQYAPDPTETDPTQQTETPAKE